ncbi:MAG: serpin family protein [Candidatus Sumerlaeia bacterium]|nr:serpin family protein [Candidatus Sumerlaeia bacterium]
MSSQSVCPVHLVRPVPAFLFAALVALCLVSPAPAAEEAEKGDVQQRMAAATTQFGFRLFAELRKEKADQNIFISPASVAFALAMTYNGAAEETQRAMAKTLGYRKMSPRDVNTANAALIESLASADPAVELAIANSLWARKGIEFDPNFLFRNRKFYGAEMTVLDFSDPKAAPTINGWVSRHTKGKIEKIVADPIPPQMVLYLINAIYFKGRWSRPFNKESTAERDFHLLDGRTKKHPMMAQGGKYLYLKHDNFQAVSLPYGQGRISLYVFLPDAESSLKAFCDSLTPETWADWMRRFRRTDGDVVLPKFKLEYEKELNDPLKAMSMAVAFDPDKADFSEMTKEKVFISEVKHKTFVEVNEEGTEAAAATSVGIALTAMPMEQERFTLVVDRPFFVAIRDNQTGMLLFMGGIVEPL